MIRSRAVQVAIGVDWEGRRNVLGGGAGQPGERHELEGLPGRAEGARARRGGVLVSDDHEGLKRAIREILPAAAWQRCYVHFLRNALDHLPRKAGDDCLPELRWLYDRREIAEARQDLARWLGKWQAKHPKLCDWVEENIEETLTYFCLPQQHHKHMKSTNMLERLNQELKRRTHVVRIFPNAEAACGWSARSRSRPTRTGWRRSATSTWPIWPSTRRRGCARSTRPPDGGRRGRAPASRMRRARPRQAQRP